MQKKKLKNQMKMNQLRSSKLRSKLRAASHSDEEEDDEPDQKVPRPKTAKPSKSQKRQVEKKVQWSDSMSDKDEECKWHLYDLFSQRKTMAQKSIRVTCSAAESSSRTRHRYESIS